MFKKISKLGLVFVLLNISSCFVEVEECKQSSECEEKYGNSAVCNDGICEVSTKALEACSETLGKPLAPNTLTIGVILALSGKEKDFGKPLKNAITVGYKDFEPIGINGSKVAVMFCDNKSSAEGSLNAAKYLAEVAKVPAIIGPEFSDHMQDILNQVLKKNETVLVSPATTATVISSFIDDDLVWRTAPSDIFQAEAIAKLLGQTKQALVDAQKPTDEIWVLAAEGIYAEGLQDGLVKNLPTNIPRDSYKIFGYQRNNFDNFYNEKLAALATPNIVVILGLAEAWKLANTIDDQHPNNNIIFLFGDGSKNQQEAMVHKNLAHQILGTAPQSVGDPNYKPYSVFRARYTSNFSDDPDYAQFLPHALDAFYVVALAAGANGFTGKEIVKGLKRLSKGEKITSDRAGAQKAFSILQADPNATINFEGASGPVDFDGKGDVGRAPITLWCFDGTELSNQSTTLLDITGKFSFDKTSVFSKNGCLFELGSM